MDNHALLVLDFDRIREMLAERAVTSMGKARCLALVPATDAAEVERRQAETAEARRLLVTGQLIGLEGVRDVRDTVWWAQWWPERGAAIKPAQLLDIVATAAAARQVRSFLLEHAAEAPLLAAQAGGIGTFPELEAAIGQAISGDGQIADAASPELARLRRRIRELQGQARSRVEALIAGLGGGAEAPYIVVRDERVLLAIAAGLRERVPGAVHATSSDGTTLFVEPAAVAAENSAIGDLVAAAKAEATGVLHRLTELVKAVSLAMQQTLDVLADVDLAFARGSLGLAMRGETPAISRQGHLNLVRARHPLLGGRVVPIDVRLGGDFDMLLVTGPNTGGKTVTLKTVGLFCLMAQAGLQIPAAAGSELPVFPEIFADVGDEQSIEQNLSTFSSHMGQIVHILDQLVPGALVLLDELGAGTDPVEGAGLAWVILERLQQRQARVIATTHYPELKRFASSHARAENAAMSFDQETLRPTYRLEIGAVGASQAFAIALRLGLDPALVEQAGHIPGEGR